VTDSTEGGASAFIDALGHLERSGEVEPLVALHAPDAVTGNVQSGAHGGSDAVGRFWSAHRATVGAARSCFSAIVAAGEHVALEWELLLPGDEAGEGVTGVTMLRYDGASIVRSWAYFNPVHLADLAERAASGPSSEKTHG
jgi:hypothetical protein